MAEQKITENSDIVGMGIEYQMPRTIPAENIWSVMVEKVYKPEKFLPVTDVKTNDITPGRLIHREMVLNGHLLKEDITLDESNYKIRALILDEGNARINHYHTDTGIMEYYQENEKGERTIWPLPKPVVFHAIEQIIELAEKSL